MSEETVQTLVTSSYRKTATARTPCPRREGNFFVFNCSFFLDRILFDILVNISFIDLIAWEFGTQSECVSEERYLGPVADLTFVKNIGKIASNLQ